MNTPLEFRPRREKKLTDMEWLMEIQASQDRPRGGLRIEGSAGKLPVIAAHSLQSFEFEMVEPSCTKDNLQVRVVRLLPDRDT